MLRLIGDVYILRLSFLFIRTSKVGRYIECHKMLSISLKSVHCTGKSIGQLDSSWQ